MTTHLHLLLGLLFLLNTLPNVWGVKKEMVNQTYVTKQVTNINNVNQNSSCNCNGSISVNFYQEQKANKMKTQMKNRTTLLSKIRHRATHSNEAMWASFTLSTILVLLSIAVLQSKMWRDRCFLSYSESQPVKFEQYNRKSEVKVKHLLRSRARSLLSMFGSHKMGETFNSLQMDNFMCVDTVDSSHRALLDSSEEEEYLDDSDSDVVYNINSVTGEWEEGEEMKGLLSRRRRGSSTSSEGAMLVNSSLARDLVRVSDDEETSLVVINAG